MEEKFSFKELAKGVVFSLAIAGTIYALSSKGCAKPVSVEMKRDIINNIENKVLNSTKNGTQLILEREVYTPKSTIGDLYLDNNLNGKVDRGDKYLCNTLELPWRNNQRNISSIPAGIYALEERRSTRHKSHYHVKDVPNRDYILVHIGNSPKDTAGCILVGKTNGDNYISESGDTLKKLRKELKGCKDIQLKVVDKI